MKLARLLTSSLRWRLSASWTSEKLKSDSAWARVRGKPSNNTPSSPLRAPSRNRFCNNCQKHRHKQSQTEGTVRVAVSDTTASGYGLLTSNKSTPRKRMSQEANCLHSPLPPPVHKAASISENYQGRFLDTLIQKRDRYSTVTTL